MWIAADTEEELDEVVEEHKKKEGSGTNGFLLRFREKPHIRMQFNPVDVPETEDLSEWTMLEVAVDDPRRLLHVLPAADAGKVLVLTNNKYDVARLGSVHDKLVSQEEVINGLKKPVFGCDEDAENNSLLLTAQTKRVCGLSRFMEILCEMALGAFLRLLEVNVDNHAGIGPLVPPCDADDTSCPQCIFFF